MSQLASIPNAPAAPSPHSLFASIADPVLILDRRLIVVDANEPLLNRLGMLRQEMVGKLWTGVFPGLTETGRAHEFCEIFADGRLRRGRIPLTNAGDGTTKLFDVATYPVEDPETGQITHLVEYAREVSEEVKLQMEVLDANNELLAVKEELESKTAEIDAANRLLEEKCLALEAMNARLERIAVLDVMTDLPNHRAFQERLTHEISKNRRYRRPFSLILLDVDNFKQYNDRYGHLQGDVLLATLARLMRESVRAIDLAARYGGEEFAVLLPETDKYGAAVVAERIRAAIASHGFAHPAVTISVGVAEFPQDAADGSSLVACADKAMYHAKSRGKNAVSLWSSLPGCGDAGDLAEQPSPAVATLRCQPVPGLPFHLPGGSASGRCLLLVDPDELTLATLREALLQAGYAVFAATSGQEALHVLSSAGATFDLILCDVVLPDKTGFELRNEARVLCPAIPMILLSAGLDGPRARLQHSDTLSEFVSKPFHLDDLSVLIDRMIEARRQAQRTAA